MNNKVSEAQAKASRAWEERNKEKTRHDTAKRQARRYIKSFLKLEDVEELRVLIEEREADLKNQGGD